MKNNLSFHSTIYLLFAISLMHLTACDSRKNANDAKSENESRLELSSTAKSRLKNVSGSFKEFVNKKKEIELIFHPAEVNGLYDPNGMIDLSVELYNPRHLAFRNYKNNLGPDSVDFKFRDVFIGSEERPWTDNLSLFVNEGTASEQVLFAVNRLGDKQQLNIGKGDIGVCRLFIQPEYFSKTGPIKFNLTFHDPVTDKKLNAETSITLKDNLVDDHQLNISKVEYLIATDEMQQALELASQMVKERPESYYARVLLGSVYEKNDQPEKALRTYRYSLGLIKNEEPDQLTEAPIGLYIKIRALEAKLKK